MKKTIGGYTKGRREYKGPEEVYRYTFTYKTMIFKHPNYRIYLGWIIYFNHSL